MNRRRSLTVRFWMTNLKIWRSRGVANGGHLFDTRLPSRRLSESLNSGAMLIPQFRGTDTRVATAGFQRGFVGQRRKWISLSSPSCSDIQFPEYS